jgi:hypothetical protein
VALEASPEITDASGSKGAMWVKGHRLTSVGAPEQAI